MGRAFLENIGDPLEKFSHLGAEKVADARQLETREVQEGFLLEIRRK